MMQKLFRLVLGLFICALGITLTIQANVGYAPWDVFHAGISNLFDITIGVASIYCGLCIVIIAFLLGEKIGVGTLLNMVLLGLLIDLIMLWNIIPTSECGILGVIMLILGLFIISYGTYLYIGSGFGAGPRDSLMVLIRRKTRFSVGLSRVLVELVVCIVGWRLGGPIGVGTLIAALCISVCVQITFKMLTFDTTMIKHETITDTISRLNSKYSS